MNVMIDTKGGCRELSGDQVHVTIEITITHFLLERSGAQDLNHLIC